MRLTILALILILSIIACGRQGAQGPTGGSGTPCTVTKIGTTTSVRCPDGTEVEISDGAKGDTGGKGDDGKDGAPGSVIEPVALCPDRGDTVYPSNFPEYALCLDNKLYGVYDQDGNHVFLAELPPGAYVSTSPSGCSFTVGDDCEITQ